MMNMRDFSFPSTDGVHLLHGVIWYPEGEPIAVVQLAHGISEHIRRFDELAAYLTKQGFLVVGHDHLGHGGSRIDEHIYTYIGDGNTWETLVADLYALHLQVRERYPHLPCFLLGHSMGSFLSRSFMIRYPDAMQGVLLMGTGWKPAPILAGGMATAAALMRLVGRDACHPLADALAFGSYNHSFAPNRTPYDWLSADTANVDSYDADPMCGNGVSLKLFYEMLRGMGFNQRFGNLILMNRSTPVLFLSGGDDPVGDKGAGVRRSYEAFRAAGMRDISMQLYPGLRHEVHQEGTHKPLVFADIHHWLQEQI